MTFTAIVTQSNGTSTPTGSVTFMDGTSILGTVNLKGGKCIQRVTFTTSALGVGTHSITAVYSGNATYSGSTSIPRILTVTKSAGIHGARTGTTCAAQCAASHSSPPLVVGRSNVAAEAAGWSHSVSTNKFSTSSVSATGRHSSQPAIAGRATSLSPRADLFAQAVDLVHSSSRRSNWLSR